MIRCGHCLLNSLTIIYYNDELEFIYFERLNKMFITRIKLENFKGIFAGIGSKVIEIDFSEYERRLILLLGKNGSGKTTLLSCLHPFSETFDERSTIILDGCEGKKEIDILSGEDLYEITHIYGKKSKSFLYKNGINLNESGGVRTFIQLVEEELGITPDFMKIIKIGSNAKNFIDLNSTARKSFLGNFTPSIDEFITAYKIVNDKFNASNKEIKYIADEINKIEKKTEITESISVKTKALRANQNNLNSLNAKIIALNTEIEKIKEDLSEFEEELAERTLSIESKEKLDKDIKDTTDKYSSLKDKDKDFLKARLLKVTNEIKILKEELATSEKALISFQEKKLAAVEKKKSAEANKRKMSSNSLRSISNEKLEALIAEEKKKLLAINNSLKNPAFDSFDCSRVSVSSSDELYTFVTKSNKFGMDIIEAKSEIIGVFSSVEEAEKALFSDGYDETYLDELIKLQGVTISY